jgi:hypothetical protein
VSTGPVYLDLRDKFSPLINYTLVCHECMLHGQLNNVTTSFDTNMDMRVIQPHVAIVLRCTKNRRHVETVSLILGGESTTIRVSSLERVKW